MGLAHVRRFLGTVHHAYGLHIRTALRVHILASAWDTLGEAIVPMARYRIKDLRFSKDEHIKIAQSHGT